MVILVATLFAALGETLLSHGMKSIGGASLSSPSRWVPWLGAVVRNPYVLGGVALVTCFFVLYLASLSWADLSFVMPLTAMSYVFGVAFAKLLLKEQVSWHRWVGVGLIVAGIVLIALDHRQLTVRTKDRPQLTATPAAERGD